jgi:hypothetical protein
MSDLEKAARMALEALEFCQIAGLATTSVVDSITALRQALEQPAIVSRAEEAYEAAKQREWVGLTDEEFEVVLPYCHNEFDLQEYKDFARAIEAKLKEKNT